MFDVDDGVHGFPTAALAVLGGHGGAVRSTPANGGSLPRADGARCGWKVSMTRMLAPQARGTSRSGASLRSRMSSSIRWRNGLIDRVFFVMGLLRVSKRGSITSS